MIVEIDKNSGFCFGVVRAISKAEAAVKELGGEVYSLGDIVHNRMEVQRLEALGLKTVTDEDMESLAGRDLFIRAHGEPPTTYRRAEELGIRVIDATCPVVAQLQRSSAADFGLRGELTYVDAILAAVNDEQNMVEKEHKIDLIRWEHAGELVPFDYFNINAILSYLVKINIVARWALLDPKRGRAMLDRIMAELDGKELVNKQ